MAGEEVEIGQKDNIQDVSLGREKMWGPVCQVGGTAVTTTLTPHTPERQPGAPNL